MKSEPQLGMDDSSVELQAIESILKQSFDQLSEVIPHDLATLFVLREEELCPHMANGALVSEKVFRQRLSLQKHPNIRESMLNNQPLVNLEKDHDEFGDPYDGVLDLPHGHSCMVIPLQGMDQLKGVITFDRQVCEPYSDATVQLAWSYSRMMSMALELADLGKSLWGGQQRLKAENQWLKTDGLNSNALDLLRRCRSPRMLAMVESLPKLAGSDLPILIGGETGTGKEVLAQAVHDLSRRQNGPFIKLNCSALSANLVESELFGHVKGAYSGAQQSRQGRFSVANGGTLLLDEIAEIPLELQAKLLRVLQEGKYGPVGSDITVTTNVRIIAATHVDLQQAVTQGRFREDLYYRLNVIPLAIPALRERREDIEVITLGVLKNIALRSASPMRRLHPLALEQMQGYAWPGNIRELINVLERAQILSESVIMPEHLNLMPVHGGGSLKEWSRISGENERSLLSLEELERQHIRKILTHCGGKISGPGGAAEILGLKPTTLRSRMDKLGMAKSKLV